MRKKTQAKTRKNRLVTVETLESRQLMTSVIWQNPVPPSDIDQLAYEIAIGRERNGLAPLTVAPFKGFETPSTEQEAFEMIEHLAIQPWTDLFGKEITEGLWRENYSWNFLAWDVASLSFSRSLSAIPSMATGLTNVQTIGVDEADLVEVTADGFLFIADQNSAVRIVDARDPADLKEVASLNVKGWNTRLYLSGNRLTVISSDFDDRPENILVSTPYRSRSVVNVYDVTSKISPKLVSAIELDGSLVSSKMANGILTLIQNSQASLPKLQRAGDLNRFETSDEFLARIRANLFDDFSPDVRQASGDGTAIIERDLLDWKDIHFVDRSSRFGTSITAIDIASEVPKVLDSEQILGLNTNLEYSDADTTYLFRQTWGTDEIPTAERLGTDIFRVQISDNGKDVRFDAMGHVIGAIETSRWADEFEGDLRIATNTQSAWISDTTSSANVYVLRGNSSKLEVIGKLEDIADGQRLDAVYFQDEIAILTTSEFDARTFLRRRDPIHVIDLSQPANPVEKSEVEIPGFSTHLQKIDAEHWVGVGSVEDANGDWHWQISLFNIADVSKPYVVETWQSEIRVFPMISLWGQDALAIHYDSASKNLVIPFTAFGSTPIIDWSNADAIQNFRYDGAWVFHIDPQLEEAVQLKSSTPDAYGVLRSFVVDDVLFAISHGSVASYAIDDEYRRLDQLTLRSNIPLYYVTVLGDKLTIENLDLQDQETIDSISTSQLGQKISILDGKRIEYDSSNSTQDGLDRLLVTLRGASGGTYVRELLVSVVKPLPIEEPKDDDPPKSDDVPIDPIELKLIQVVARAVNDLGEEIDTVQVNDEFWIELGGEDLREDSQGLFGAYFDALFDQSRLEIVDKVQRIGSFSNRVAGKATDEGMKGVGSFSTSLETLGDGPQWIVRFKVRALQEGNAVINVRAVDNQTDEILLYGRSNRVSPANVTPAQLVVKVGESDDVQAKILASESRHDVNGDGEVEPLDALIIINYLNLRTSGEAESVPFVEIASSDTATAKLDINQDGRVTPLDVLWVINRLNRDAGNSLEGESDQNPSETESTDTNPSESTVALADEGIPLKRRLSPRAL